MTASRMLLMRAIVGIALGGLAAAANAEPISQKVSVRELLANPAKFHHKRVLVGGYLWFEPEAKALVLYHSRVPFAKRPRGDAIWIDMLACGHRTCTDSEIRRSQFHQDRLARYLGRHIELEGTASKAGKQLGNRGMYGASIFEITRVTTEGWDPETFSRER